MHCKTSAPLIHLKHSSVKTFLVKCLICILNDEQQTFWLKAKRVIIAVTHFISDVINPIHKLADILTRHLHKYTACLVASQFLFHAHLHQKHALCA